MDVSIIIVNYNTCDVTRSCLKSVFEHTKDIDFEVIVSDNGSKDDSVKMIKQEFPQVILIENNANLGFGTANNRGLKIAKGKYIFYLNSDTILLNNAVKIFFEYWENSLEKDKIGALGCNLMDKELQVNHSYCSFPKASIEIAKFIRRIIVVYIKCIFNILGLNYKKYATSNNYQLYIGNVDYVTGADLFVINDKNAYFDERFFLYYEETDLQWKIMQNGLLRKIIDGPKIIHLQGNSDSRVDDGALEDYVSFGTIQSDLSRIRFIKYNISNMSAFILKILLYWMWLTPIFFRKTNKYRKEIFKI